MAEITEEISRLRDMNMMQLMAFLRWISMLYDIVLKMKKLGKLPVAYFAADNIYVSAKGVMMMKMGEDGVFLSSILNWDAKFFKPIIDAIRYHNDP